MEKDRKERRRAEISQHRAALQGHPEKNEASSTTFNSDPFSSSSSSSSTFNEVDKALEAAVFGLQSAWAAASSSSAGLQPDLITKQLSAIKAVIANPYVDITGSGLASPGVIAILFQLLKSQNNELMRDSILIISNISCICAHEIIQPIVAEIPTLNTLLQGYLGGQLNDDLITENAIKILGYIADYKQFQSSLSSCGSPALILACLSESAKRNATTANSAVVDTSSGDLRIALSSGFSLTQIAMDPSVSYSILSNSDAISTILTLLKHARDQVKIEAAEILSQLCLTEMNRVITQDSSNPVARTRPPAISVINRSCMEILTACKGLYSASNSKALNRLTCPLWKAISNAIGSFHANPIPSDVDDLVYLIPLVSDYIAACTSPDNQSVLKECIWTFNCACMLVSSINQGALKSSYALVSDLVCGSSSRLPGDILPVILHQLVKGKQAIQKESLFALKSIMNLGILTREMFSREVIAEYMTLLEYGKEIDVYLEILKIIKQAILIDPSVKQIFVDSNIAEIIDNLQYTCQDTTVAQLCVEITEILYAFMEEIDDNNDEDDDEGGERVVNSSAAFSFGNNSNSSNAYSFGGGGAPSGGAGGGGGTSFQLR